MRRYLIFIVLLDGSRRTIDGLYPSDWAAIDAALIVYPQSVGIVPRRAH
ncbi:TPA: hypothetical protein QDC22_007524 [Burkholderia stabilis]|nr:hypothetical protein [Burkholderia stabilis]HDR9589135.1 hypothetical protein [Burkholderia stabilis]HDR9649531.1 hypothetical protein [Burkholderia stabilis]HDR9653597.1 hypothetical protein [Burkholderia stabilis]HDR9656292.1 hypothetical protein [Burkholderia stabilis]